MTMSAVRCESRRRKCPERLWCTIGILGLRAKNILLSVSVVPSVHSSQIRTSHEEMNCLSHHCGLCGFDSHTGYAKNHFLHTFLQTFFLLYADANRLTTLIRLNYNISSVCRETRRTYGGNGWRILDLRILG